jgi:hypothetical protein
MGLADVPIPGGTQLYEATPAISILVALFLLGEQPTLILIVALALILTGMAVGMSGPAAGAPRR